MSWGIELGLENSRDLKNARGVIFQEGKNCIDECGEQSSDWDERQTFSAILRFGCPGTSKHVSNIFPVFVSCGIESGLENSDVFEHARTPVFPEPLSGVVHGAESVSMRRERFGPVNYE